MNRESFIKIGITLIQGRTSGQGEADITQRCRESIHVQSVLLLKGNFKIKLALSLDKKRQFNPDFGRDQKFQGNSS